MTVPNQSLSLNEIVKRFVRREALPVMHDGVYEERFGDLEKLKYADIYDRREKAKELKALVDEFNAREKVRIDADAKAKKDAADLAFKERIISEYKASIGGGESPLKSPPIGA